MANYTYPITPQTLTAGTDASFDELDAETQQDIFWDEVQYLLSPQTPTPDGVENKQDLAEHTVESELNNPNPPTAYTVEELAHTLVEEWFEHEGHIEGIDSSFWRNTHKFSKIQRDVADRAEQLWDKRKDEY